MPPKGGCLFRIRAQKERKRSAAAPFQCLGSMPPEGSTRAGILPGCPSLDRGSRVAEVGFKPRTFRSCRNPRAPVGWHDRCAPKGFCSRTVITNNNTNRPAVAPFRCLAAMPHEGGTRAGILPGRPILDRGNREAEVGFEPRTFRRLLQLGSKHSAFTTLPILPCVTEIERYCSLTRATKWLEREFAVTGRSVVRTRPLPLDLLCLGLGNLAVSQPSCLLRVAWQLGIKRWPQIRLNKFGPLIKDRSKENEHGSCFPSMVTHTLTLHSNGLCDYLPLGDLNTNSKRIALEVFELFKRKKSVSKGRSELLLQSLFAPSIPDVDTDTESISTGIWDTSQFRRCLPLIGRADPVLTPGSNMSGSSSPGLMTGPSVGTTTFSFAPGGIYQTPTITAEFHFMEKANEEVLAARLRASGHHPTAISRTSSSRTGPQSVSAQDSPILGCSSVPAPNISHFSSLSHSTSLEFGTPSKFTPSLKTTEAITETEGIEEASESKDANPSQTATLTRGSTTVSKYSPLPDVKASTSGGGSPTVRTAQLFSPVPLRRAQLDQLVQQDIPPSPTSLHARQKAIDKVVVAGECFTATGAVSSEPPRSPNRFEAVTGQQMFPSDAASSVESSTPSGKNYRPINYPQWARWLSGYCDRKVRGSNPTSASRLPLSRLGPPGSILALVLPSGGMAVRHRKDVTLERFPTKIDIQEVKSISANQTLDYPG
ncbi:hypothetical protein T265_08067 [Opisthorchis viverrini]|uniref:Uncharacterized protein n=1 Tax=Opisthorchis viverrini TaxID=6198 RepID=A0A074ZAC5_OPIVI|nr:hypothetical protein T265_08067 [Opisthorchis viverrini]KER24221.1 hypothetical protein T265_08067 [Opisthorchis viverrini]